MYMMPTPVLGFLRRRFVQLARTAWSECQAGGSIIETPITANFRERLIRTPVLHLPPTVPVKGLADTDHEDRQLRLPDTVVCLTVPRSGDTENRIAVLIASGHGAAT